MAAPMSFCPGGADFDDDDDDDGFFLDGHGSAFNNNSQMFNQSKPSQSRQPNDEPASTRPEGGRGRGFGGFGAPPSKKNANRTRSKVERPRDVSLNDSDFQNTIIRGQVAVVQKFIQQGINVNLVLNSGWTGAMYAANVGNAEMLQLLLDTGADPNYNKEQYTVLMAACGASGKPEAEVLTCVELLLARGAQADAYDRYHTTPLMYAAREGRSKVIQKLASTGANVDKQDNRGWTALTWAVSKNHPAAVRALIEARADPRKRHTDGLTVIEMADENSLDEMLEILEGKKRPEFEPSSSAASANDRLADPAAGNGISSGGSVGTKYGELELFLCGLDLGHLVALFHDHHVDFNTLLRMTEDDLTKMGISQLGVRKKILDGTHSVHKKDWEKSSLPALNYKKQISCAEALAVVANISKHTMYIATTVGYLGDQIHRNPAMVEELQDGTGSKQLLHHTGDTLRNVTNLQKQLTTLQTQLNKDISPSDPPDFVKHSPRPRTSRYRHAVILLTGTAVGGLLVWKRQTVWDLIIRLVSPAAD